MNSWQALIIGIYTLLNVWAFLRGWYEVRVNKNPYGLTRMLVLIGSFVWADALILGFFWMLVGVGVLLIESWQLWLVIIGIFWIVRSVGEIIYWLNQQFSAINRNPPHTLLFGSMFPDESIWFVHQLYWQCVLVLSSVVTLYFVHGWLTA